MKKFFPYSLSWLKRTLTVLIVCAAALASVSAGKDSARTQWVTISHAQPELIFPIPEQIHPAPKKKIVWMEVTAYCACPKCCGPKATGLTASGKSVTYNAGHFVAADTKNLPFGTKLSIPGYHDGQHVEVIDRGSAIKGNKLDVFFPSHEQAKTWGRRWIPVTVVE